ncbi:MAG TPA: DUF4398 domain-containing protein [Aquabacterium sp.]|nr:DUF4398 domain-containing protein [Aquabacterium sp.]
MNIHSHHRPLIGGLRGQHLAWLLTLAVVATTTGCASTPPAASTAQIAVTEAALNHASSAGGAEMAPTEMAAARDKLVRANAAMTAREFDQALRLAEEAQVDALLAEVKARATKAQRAADELREGRRVLREELDRKSK